MELTPAPRRARLAAPTALIAGLALAPAAAASQDDAATLAPPPTYLPQGDTLWYERTGPYRVYWVRGADSVGWEGDDAAVEAHVWRAAAGDSLLGVLHRLAPGPERTIDVDTVLVDASGALRAVRGTGASWYALRDLLPPLPREPGALEAGRTWVDTLTATWSDAFGEHTYALTRAVEVWEVADSLGTRVARFRAEGMAELRITLPLDAAATVVAMLDVRGPVEETYRVDLSAGRVLARAWSARLEGDGEIRVEGDPPERLPAGMIARGTLASIGPDRARLLARPLPGADTTWATSFEDGREALHTSATAEGRTVGGHALAGGVVSTVELRLERDRLGEVRWLRTAPGQPSREVHLGSPSGGMGVGAIVPPLEVEGLGYWIPGHEELLVPLAVALPVDSVGRRVAVWSVPDERWVEADLLLLERDGVVLAVFTFDRPLPVLSLLVEDGRILYVERGTDGERGPLPGTPQRDYVDDLVRSFLEARPPPPLPDRRS
jgi:hypothetical protein